MDMSAACGQSVAFMTRLVLMFSIIFLFFVEISISLI